MDSIILIYDISNRESFEECKTYYRNTIKEKCRDKIKVLLIGNKNDYEEKRKVTTEEGYDFALENNYLFMEGSCFKNDCIYEAFETLIIETILLENITLFEKNFKMKKKEFKSNNNLFKYINY